jgi:hypothetical protein
MGRLLAAPDRSLDLVGFGGPNGVEALLKHSATNLLIERKLIAPPGTTANEDELRSLQISDLRALEDLVFKACGWPAARSRRPLVRVKAFHCRRSRPKNPSGDILNSFVAADLLKVKDAVRQDRIGAAGARTAVRGEPDLA